MTGQPANTRNKWLALSGGEVSGWYPKYAFDALRIADSNLNVSFRIKACAGIDGSVFDEDPANGFDSVRPFDKGMDMLDDSAVELPTNLVFVDRHGCARRVKDFFEVFVGRGHHSNSNRRHEVKAASKIYNCANDRRSGNLFYALFLHLGDEIQSALRINFPEVYSSAQPIIIVRTGFKRRSC